VPAVQGEEVSNKNAIPDLCPECGVEILTGSYRIKGQMRKTCPNGHTTAADKLRAERWLRTAPSIQARNESLELALTAMLEGYSRAVATMPPMAAGLMAGAFGKAPDIALEVLK
jgi:hypothetical protein